ncbi:hypothetical protein B0H14DRAFT_2994980 [Mycena olivaceomarginata]|nr:hypothetical protein B0H14DRAFT_2994980 [Mycena olivaceomarginata]
MSGPVLLLAFFALSESSSGMAETGERAITQYGGFSHPPAPSMPAFFSFWHEAGCAAAESTDFGAECLLRHQ